jgi:hypothetical protein
MQMYLTSMVSSGLIRVLLKIVLSCCYGIVAEGVSDLGGLVKVVVFV